LESKHHRHEEEKKKRSKELDSLKQKKLNLKSDKHILSKDLSDA
jgi:hypothetical protein